MNPFSICIGFGAALGMVNLALRSKPARVDTALNSGIIFLISGLMGARAGYILLHIEYFSANPTEIPLFWKGGLSWIGCAAGLIFAAAIIPKMFQIPLASAYDQMIALSIPLSAAAWLGGWLTGVGYGPLLSPPTWPGLTSLDETGSLAVRLPLQIICAILIIADVTILEWALSHSKTLKNRFTGLAGLFLAGDLLLFSVVRADPVRELFAIRIDTLAAATLLFLSILALLLLPTSNSGKSRQAV
jgi:phosphatidylglycerol---prolipoprotein diacylglyceryl transferase